MWVVESRGGQNLREKLLPNYCKVHLVRIHKAANFQYPVGLATSGFRTITTVPGLIKFNAGI